MTQRTDDPVPRLRRHALRTPAPSFPSPCRATPTSSTPPIAPSQVLPGLTSNASLRRPNRRPAEVRADVGAPDDDQHPQDQPRPAGDRAAQRARAMHRRTRHNRWGSEPAAFSTDHSPGYVSTTTAAITQNARPRNTFSHTRATTKARSATDNPTARTRSGRPPSRAAERMPARFAHSNTPSPASTRNTIAKAVAEAGRWRR